MDGRVVNSAEHWSLFDAPIRTSMIVDNLMGSTSRGTTAILQWRC